MLFFNIISGFAILCSLIAIYILYDFNEDLKYSLKMSEKSLKVREEQLDRAHKAEEYYKNLYISNTIQNQVAVDAARIAMRLSHPDNGGNMEDFIKFKKCYEHLKEVTAIKW